MPSTSTSTSTKFCVKLKKQVNNDNNIFCPCCNCEVSPSTSIDSNFKAIDASMKNSDKQFISSPYNYSNCEVHHISDPNINRCDCGHQQLETDTKRIRKNRRQQGLVLKAQAFMFKFIPLMEKCHNRRLRKFSKNTCSFEKSLARKQRSTAELAHTETLTIENSSAQQSLHNDTSHSLKFETMLATEVNEKDNENTIVTTPQCNLQRNRPIVLNIPPLNYENNICAYDNKTFDTPSFNSPTTPSFESILGIPTLSIDNHLLLPEQISYSGSSPITHTFDELAKDSPNLAATIPLHKDSIRSDTARSTNSNISSASTHSRATPTAVLTALGMLRETKTFSQLLNNSLLQISVDTMAITALPLDCWLKERLKNWVQLSGHEGTIVPASNHTLWKKQPSSNTAEAIAYAEIMKDDMLRGLTPKFYREILHKNESFIEIQDLLSQFPNTSARAVMDIKIGVRTFLESEVSNTTKRTDLYKKMIDINPNEPTEQEHADGAITKLRYMQFREHESSTASLGFRIEAAQSPGGKLQKCFKKVNTRMNVQKTLMNFFGKRHAEIRKQLSERLKAMRNGIEKSKFFKMHEIVGSSILIVYDDCKTGAWMIDFAKSIQLPEGVTVNHKSQWQLGNHEDGYLIGLNNLIEILEMDIQDENDPLHD